MTLGLGQTRDPAALVPADVGALHRAAALWKARALAADEVEETLTAGRTLPEWSGEAADAYEGRVVGLISAWNATAAAFRAGEAAVEELAAALDAARAKASDAVALWEQAEALDAAAFQETPDPPSGFLGPDRRMFLGSGVRAEAQAVLADAREAVVIAAQQAAAQLRAAIASPDLGADEWAAILTGCASSAQVLDAFADAGGSSITALLRGIPSLAGLLAQAEPAGVTTWWEHLEDTQKNALIRAAPAVIGNLGGVAYAARDEANRIWLRQQLREARSALAEAEKTPSYRELVGGYATASAVAERLSRARARVAGLEGVEAALVAPEGKAARHLISLTSDAPPLAAVSIGDLDTADDVTYAVPGMSTTSTAMGDWTRASQNIATAQDQFDPDHSHAVVAWVGYKTPAAPVLEGDFDVLGTGLAEAGGNNLANDIRALDLVRPEARTSVVAHSYGTTTASLALVQDDVHVDAFVSLGSAGLPPEINEASYLHAGEVFAGQAQDVLAVDPAGGDQWAWVGRTSPAHPVNPIDPGFRAHAFSVAGDGHLLPVTDHGVTTQQGTGYLDGGTESLRNVTMATIGRSDQVTAFTAPGPTVFQQGLIEGTTHGWPL